MRILFDREVEKDSIGRVLRSAEDGISSVLWLEGQSGTGKSALLDYAISETTAKIIPFYSERDFFKCTKRTADESFSCVSGLLSTLEKENRRVFYRYLDRYVSRFARISLSDSILDVLPSLSFMKWSKNVLSRARRQKDVVLQGVSKCLLDRHLMNCFIELITNIFESDYCEIPIIICIDDIAWIDEPSLSILTSVSRRLVSNQITCLSFLCATRDYYSIEEKEAYAYVEDSFKLATNNFCSLCVENFSQHITYEYLGSLNRNYLDANSRSIYELTSGNLQELSQAIKLPNTELNKRIVKYSRETNNDYGFQPYISQDVILTEIINSRLSLIILGILSLIEEQICVNTLLLIGQKYELLVSSNILNYHELDCHLEILIDKKKLVSLKGNNVSVSHDSVADIIITYLVEAGLLPEMSKSIANLINGDPACARLFSPTTRISTTLHILRPVDPKLAFHEFMNYFENDGSTISLPRSLVELASDCLVDWHDLTLPLPFIRRAISLLDMLVNYTSLNCALRLSNYLWNIRDRMPLDLLAIFSYSFTKTLIDFGHLDSGNEPCAKEVIGRIKLNPHLSSFEKARMLLLENSLHEHLLAYNRIVENDKVIKTLISDIINITERSIIAVIWLRNKGLSLFHGNLEKAYKKSISIVNRYLPSDDTNNILLLGTCWNNLGLSYFYQQKIDKAIDAFTKAFTYLDQIQYDGHRPLNNISACYVLLGEYEKAYDTIISAKHTRFRGVFEKISIDLNYSLVLWKLGREDMAIEVVMKYVHEYNQGDLSTSDTWVYAGAMYLAGYYYYQKEDYYESLQHYKASKFHTYRFSDDREKHRRNVMIDICLRAIGLPTSFNEDDYNIIDFNGKSLDLYQKPYDIQLLAFYII